MNKAKYNAKQVANWFISRVIADVPNGGDYLTQLKLQKLLYFAQGFNLILNDQPLFSDKIVHRTYGPVVNTIAQIFINNHKGAEPIKELFDDVGETKFSDKEIAMLEVVYDKFGQYSAYKLVEITHKTSPWIETSDGEEITLKEIKKYFMETFVE